MNPSCFLAYFRGVHEYALELLRRMVEIESSSSDKEGLDRMASFLAQEFDSRGASVHVLPEAASGNHLLCRIGPEDSAEALLVLGHTDTVWPRGTLSRRPFRLDRERAFGPGVYDMKAGLLLTVLVCDAYKAGLWTSNREIRFLFTSDEETGTATGLPAIRKYSASCCAALCLEPPLPDGGLKTARKGVGTYDLRVRGVAAHAGVEPEKGASAILEISRQIAYIHSLGEPGCGITLNVGTVLGGTASNVIAPEASAAVDLRYRSDPDGAILDRQLKDLKPFDRRCTLQMDGGINRPPMVRTAEVGRLFGLARRIANSLGFGLSEGESGGGSDGSFTAAMGIPTLDGLGVPGAGAHAEHENIRVEEVVPRAALLAGLLEAIGTEDGAAD